MTSIGSQPAAVDRRPVVAVDANGADLGAAEVAAAADLAAERGIGVILFGPAEQLEGVGSGVEVVDAPVSIAKAPDPVRAARATPESSIVQAARAVAQGRAQALVSGGSTGAALAACLFNVKRARGVYRPALAVSVPVPGHPVTMLDVGANADARAEHLVQFAFMGAAFASVLLGLARPRVGLLSNGEEGARGSALVLEAHAALRARAEGSQALDFVGNVEGAGLLDGAADVVVTDGFTGNVALKVMEGVSQTILRAIRDAARSEARARAGGLLMRPALLSLRDQIDPERQGGAYLLGLRRLAVVPHGRFTRIGFAEAIVRAERGARQDLVGRTHTALELAGALRASPASEAAASVPGA